MLKKLFSGSLSQKLLIPTTLVLAFSIISLSFILVAVQQQQLTKLSDSVLSSIGKITSDAKNSFGVMEKEVNSYLQHMSKTASETIASSTKQALEAEQGAIRSGMDEALRNNANSIADLLAQVAPGAILSNNFLELISYAKSATQNAAVVYAIYLRPNGKPMTRYINKKDPIIQKYLSTGKGKKKIQKIMNASRKDDSVFIIEKPVSLEGKNFGRILLCIDKSSVEKEIDQMSNRFSTLINNNTDQIHSVLNGESKKITNKMKQMLETVSSKNSAAADNIADTIRNSSNAVKSKAQFISTVLGGASIAFVFVILFFILTRISKTILKKVDNLNLGAEKVSLASDQITATSQSLAEGSSEQASSLEETSSSLEEMSSMTKQNADNVNQADSLMKDANRIVGDANASMAQLTQSMDEISQASEETSKIIKTIDEIAFQTNLLALNAAVEAARAGEAGAGFAVVADEVRNLAMRAADAAKNTANLIEDTVKKIGEGGSLVGRTNDAFSEVATSTSKVAQLLGEIAAASNEQAQGIEQVNKAVAEMDKVTQRNAANAEETAASSEEMSLQAETMNAMVNELLVLVGGRKKAGNHKVSMEIETLKS